MINALELDDLMASLTPEQADAIRQRLPSGFADQIAAATIELEAQAEMICDRPGATARLPATDVPDWLRLGLLDAFVTWVTGKATTCLHADPVILAPVWACAWRPTVACSRCLYLHRTPRLSDEDRRCDFCGRLTCFENGDGITPIVLALGSFGYRAGCCESCVPQALREEAAA